MIVKQTLSKDDADIKANFDKIYVKDDPREYFRVLHGLDYIIPDLAAPVLTQIAETLTQARKRPIKVLDLGSSYGTVSALLRLPIDIDRLSQRYRDLQAFGLTSAKVIELDRAYFASWPRCVDVTTVGLDISAPAIAYGKATGLLDQGFAENLEQRDPSPALQAALRDVDLIVSTGCVGYVGARTFARLLAAIGNPSLWVASFVLRLYPFDAIAETLRRGGLETEKLESVTFVQRRFHSAREYDEIITALEAQGIDTAGKEADGMLLAELFVSRPPAERGKLPMDDMVSVTRGVSRVQGRRFTRHRDDVVRLVR